MYKRQAQVQALDAELAAHPIPGVRETTPSYRALLVVYAPQHSSALTVRAALEQALARLGSAVLPEKRRLEIPVHYGGSDGPDLEEVARSHGLTPAEGIARHTAPTYRVAMLGFAPGFAYLLGLDPRLAMPRLATPRPHVPAGSIGIAGDQMEKIFEKFQQVDGSARRRAEGTGLGLAITRYLVEMHGGTVSVHSVEKKGSVFTVSLPALSSSEAPKS